MSVTKNSRHFVSLALILFYLFVRFGLDSWWRARNQYFGYGFELAFFGLVAWFFRARLRWSLSWTKEIIFGAVPAFVCGAAIFLLIRQSGLQVPFDFKSLELVFLLLIVAPILEELIFRMALWEPTQEILNSSVMVLILTTIFFSIGHLIALWAVPAEYKPFVLVQSLYVLLLGLGAGYRRLISGSVVSAVLVHFGFNLGFYCASLIN